MGVATDYCVGSTALHSLDQVSSTVGERVGCAGLPYHPAEGPGQASQSAVRGGHGGQGAGEGRGGVQGADEDSSEGGTHFAILKSSNLEL